MRTVERISLRMQPGFLRDLTALFEDFEQMWIDFFVWLAGVSPELLERVRLINVGLGAQDAYEVPNDDDPGGEEDGSG